MSEIPFVTNAQPDVPDTRDLIYEPPLIPLKKEIAAPMDAKILDQGSEGACVGFALAATINQLKREGGDDVTVSARMLYVKGVRERGQSVISGKLVIVKGVGPGKRRFVISTSTRPNPTPLVRGPKATHQRGRSRNSKIHAAGNSRSVMNWTVGSGSGGSDLRFPRATPLGPL